MNQTKYIVDIDDTICTPTYGKYNLAKPYKNRIKKINELYENGHIIIYFTARGMGRSNNNIIIAYKECYELTFKQLNEWGCKFHELYLGKPNGDYYIDDKSILLEDFFSENKKK